MTVCRRYWCPTSGDVECCPEHSGWDVCCAAPEHHVRYGDQLRAITIRQPWAGAVASGAKLVENRVRSTSYRGLVAVHAGQRTDRDALDDPRIVAASDADYRTTGKVVAVAELHDCHRALPGAPCCQPWGDPPGAGPLWHLQLRNARRLNNPVAARGTLGLPWRLDPEVTAEVLTDLGAGAQAARREVSR